MQLIETDAYYSYLHFLAASSLALSRVLSVLNTWESRNQNQMESKVAFAFVKEKKKMIVIFA